jgi:nickel-type superoxide dismutase maturation protease
MLRFVISFREIILWIVGRRKRFVVSGNSMKPTFLHGDMILLNPQNQRIQEDDIVLLEHPQVDLILVKRVMFEKEGRFFVQGDNKKESTDSRHFGMVSRSQIQGVVTIKLRSV